MKIIFNCISKTHSEDKAVRVGQAAPDTRRKRVVVHTVPAPDTDTARRRTARGKARRPDSKAPKRALNLLLEWQEPSTPPPRSERLQ